MKRNTLLKSVLAGLLILSMASCGSDNSTGGSSSSSGNSSVSQSQVESNEGNVQAATSIADFRKKVRLGKFAKPNISNGACGNYGLRPVVEYSLCEVTTSTSDFLWWDDVVTNQSLDCNSSGAYKVVEKYATGEVSGSPYGNTKTEIINSLLSLIDNNDQIDFSRTGGYQYNMYKMVVKKGSKFYHIDLQSPIAANPIFIEDENTSVEPIAAYPYYYTDCQSY